MVVAEEKSVEVEERMIETLQASTEPVPASKLIDELKNEGLSEELIRRALWYLIEYRRIQLTPERQLTIGAHPQKIRSTLRGGKQARRAARV